MRILLVCTGNLVRSPMAQLLLASQLTRLGVDAEIASAGTRATGAPSPSLAVAVLADREMDLSGHVSHRLQATDVESADLVIGMAREHVREAALAHPESWQRTFTLRELVRRGFTIGPRRADETPADWLARIHAGRHPAELLGNDPMDDVEDPIGGARDAYERTALEIGGLLQSLVLLLWPGEAHNALA